MGPVPFPADIAAARRMLGVGQTMRDAGFDVLIGSGQVPRAQGGAPTEVAGLEVHSLGERTAEGYPLLVKHLLYFLMGRRTVQWLEGLDPRPRAVILYSGYSPYFMRLLPWCRRQGVPLIFDSVEWYDPESIPGGRYSPNRWNFELGMRYYCPRVGSVIAISRFLEEYFGSRGCTTVRIPPTLDTKAIEPSLVSSVEGDITLGYSGNPGRKDLFDNVLEAVLCLVDEGVSVRLRVAGLSPEQVLRFPAARRRGLGRLPPGIEALGWISHSDAMGLIGDADYGVLLRVPRRESRAGFPTKVVESLAVGTPIICNLTSDLGEHIRDGIEGIVCEDYSVGSLIESVRGALAFPAERRRAMRFAARKRAESSFDYRNYVTPLTRFLEDLGVGTADRSAAVSHATTSGGG